MTSMQPVNAGLNRDSLRSTVRGKARVGRANV